MPTSWPRPTARAWTTEAVPRVLGARGDRRQPAPASAPALHRLQPSAVSPTPRARPSAQPGIEGRAGGWGSSQCPGRPTLPSSVYPSWSVPLSAHLSGRSAPLNSQGQEDPRVPGLHQQKLPLLVCLLLGQERPCREGPRLWGRPEEEGAPVGWTLPPMQALGTLGLWRQMARRGFPAWSRHCGPCNRNQSPPTECRAARV